MSAEPVPDIAHMRAPRAIALDVRVHIGHRDHLVVHTLQNEQRHGGRMRPGLDIGEHRPHFRTREHGADAALDVAVGIPAGEAGQQRQGRDGLGAQQ